MVLEAETTDITGVKHVYTKVMAADPTAGAAVPPGAKRLGFAFNTLYEKLPAVATPQRLAVEFAVAMRSPTTLASVRSASSSVASKKLLFWVGAGSRSPCRSGPTRW